MNTSWLAGKSLGLPGTPTESEQAAKEYGANDQPGTSDGFAQWLSGWGVYWCVALLLACSSGWGLFDLACFIALVRWFSSGKTKDRQNQTDRLYRAKKEDSFSIYDFANDYFNNPLYSSFPGNVAHEDHTWDDDDWARGHWPSDQDYWH